ncbi:hypothetical protein GIB67_041934 [Kingdonia uniflora]|uniref:Uncharacterized protein n=1 Tax=Kingdonia uniflora TaxID=39325 RepID=A0A7J7N1H6_9MAGN|nr:hypothetical protein GIB67_041934 [Kingdonia uniflora]
MRMLPPSRSMSSSLNPMEQSPMPSPIHVGGSHEHFDTSGGVEDPEWEEYDPDLAEEVIEDPPPKHLTNELNGLQEKGEDFLQMDQQDP